MVWSNVENPILSCTIINFSFLTFQDIRIFFFTLNPFNPLFQTQHISLPFPSYSIVSPPLCSPFQLSYSLHIILSPLFCILSLFCQPVGSSEVGQAKHWNSVLNTESSWFPVLIYVFYYFSCLHICNHISLLSILMNSRQILCASARKEKTLSKQISWISHGQQK